VKDWLSRNWPWLLTTGLGWVVAAILAVSRGEPIPAPPVIPQQPQPAEAAPVGDVPAGLGTGWQFDAETVAANLDPEQTQQFRDTPAGKSALGDEDVFLWQAVRRVNNRGPPWYPNINQGSVGSCVGAGNKHGCDVVQATAILAGSRATWKPAAVEPIYAGSRVEVGGGRIRGDGSVGAWAAKWLSDRGGMVPMEKVGRYDLTSYSAERAREWGRSGVPDDLEPAAREHPVKGAALVRTWPDVLRAIQQGYPVVVCSDQGFTMARDAEGFARPSGTWAHCMVFIGARGGSRPGAFCLNSWGDKVHTGPVWPADAPVAGFWVDSSIVQRMVAQGDSFALSDVVGFPRRRLDWKVQADSTRSDYALAPDVSRPDYTIAP
jgi:hypothetical protein